jgi:hypothetical protein
MKDDITKKMWGIFDETGIFLALCRHGFTLVIADMVMSGELSVIQPLSFALIAHVLSMKCKISFSMCGEAA